MSRCNTSHTEHIALLSHCTCDSGTQILNNKSKFKSRKPHSVTQQPCAWRLVTYPSRSASTLTLSSPRPTGPERPEKSNTECTALSECRAPKLEKRNVTSSDVIDLGWPRKGGGINENNAFHFAVTARVYRAGHKDLRVEWKSLFLRIMSQKLPHGTKTLYTKF